MDAAETPLFTQQDMYLAGVIVALSVSHDSSSVDVTSLAGAERFLVPNTRMEFVSEQDYSRVVAAFKSTRDQVSKINKETAIDDYHTVVFGGDVLNNLRIFQACNAQPFRQVRDPLSTYNIGTLERLWA